LVSLFFVSDFLVSDFELDESVELEPDELDELDEESLELLDDSLDDSEPPSDFFEELEFLELPRLSVL
jgi:hypothetical protein